MNRGDIGKCRAVDILNMHLPADRSTKFAYLAGTGQAAQPVRFYLHALRRAQPPGVKMVLKAVHAFIQHYGLRHARCHLGTLIQRFAGLFDPVTGHNAVQHLNGCRGLPGPIHIKGH